MRSPMQWVKCALTWDNFLYEMTKCYATTKLNINKQTIILSIVFMAMGSESIRCGVCNACVYHTDWGLLKLNLKRSMQRSLILTITTENALDFPLNTAIVFVVDFIFWCIQLTVSDASVNSQQIHFQQQVHHLANFTDTSGCVCLCVYVYSYERIGDEVSDTKTLSVPMK